MTLRVSRRRHHGAWLASSPIRVDVHGKRVGLADVSAASHTLGGALRRWAERLRFYRHIWRVSLDAARTRQLVALVVRDTGKRWRVRT